LVNNMRLKIKNINDKYMLLDINFIYLKKLLE
jgi:hypothetical protein